MKFQRNWNATGTDATVRILHLGAEFKFETSLGTPVEKVQRRAANMIWITRI